MTEDEGVPIRRPTRGHQRTRKVGKHRRGAQDARDQEDLPRTAAGFR